jgi:hypothetical protein
VARCSPDRWSGSLGKARPPVGPTPNESLISYNGSKSKNSGRPEGHLARTPNLKSLIRRNLLDTCSFVHALRCTIQCTSAFTYDHLPQHFTTSHRLEFRSSGLVRQRSPKGAFHPSLGQRPARNQSVVIKAMKGRPKRETPIPPPLTKQSS